MRTLKNINACWMLFYLSLPLLFGVEYANAQDAEPDKYGGIDFNQKVVAIRGESVTINFPDLKGKFLNSTPKLYLPKGDSLIESDGEKLQNQPHEPLQMYLKDEQSSQNFADLVKEIYADSPPFWAYHLLGNHYYKRGKKDPQYFKAARRKYEAAIRRNPTFPVSHLYLARVYLELKEQTKADREYKLAWKYNLGDIDVFNFRDLGGEFGKLKDIPKDMNIKMYPEHYKNTFDELASGVDVSDEYSSAGGLSQYLTPDQAEQYRLYTMIHHFNKYIDEGMSDKSKYGKAFLSYQKMLKEEKSLDAQTRAIIYENMAVCLNKAGWVAEAEEYQARAAQVK